jgi:hypothetical protein
MLPHAATFYAAGLVLLSPSHWFAGTNVALPRPPRRTVEDACGLGRAPVLPAFPPFRDGKSSWKRLLQFEGERKASGLSDSLRSEARSH